MQKERKSKSNFKKAVVLSTALFAVFCVGIILSTMSFQDVVEVQQIKPAKFWRKAHGDADPGGDNSGYMYTMTYVHQAVPATAYASNLSNSSGKCLEYSDSLDTEMTGETNHTVAFDFVHKFRVNDTVGYNVTSSAWEPTWMYANITVDFDFGSDVAWTSMTLVEIANNTDFAWYHGYIDNAAAGYTLTHNEKFNLTVNTSFWW